MVLLFLGADKDRILARNFKTACRPLNPCRLAVASWIVLSACVAQAVPSPPDPAEPETLILDSRSAQKGMSEWGWNMGGATRIPGGAGTRGFWTMNLRWGRILTSSLGPGPLRGTLEYTVEIVPAFVLKQSTTVFGGGVNPLLLQYNFTRSRRVVPFLQFGGGTLFTNQTVPEGTSQINFTPQGGIGIYMFRRLGSAFALGIRYHHISNAGMVRPNPGHNSLYFYSGISWWR